MSVAHPNFPEGLNISPLRYQEDCIDFDQTRAIKQYGIAGRVWEASQLMSSFLSLSAAHAGARREESGMVGVEIEIDPECSIFNTQEDLCIIELGSGTGLVGVHLANLISANIANRSHCRTRLILTDLFDVCPLIQDTVKRAQLHSGSLASTKMSHDVDISVVPLPWGDADKAGELSHHLEIKGNGRKVAVTHIICSDLIYFPHLLAPLLRSLIQLTSAPFISTSVDSDSHTHPQVLISYKVRSLTKEASFWSALGLWFTFHPVFIRETLATRSEGPMTSDWRHLGVGIRSSGTCPEEDDATFVFVASRRPESFHWPIPEADEDLLAGMGAYGTLSTKGDDTFETMLMMQMAHEEL